MVDITFNLKNFEYALLILVRIASFIYVAPFFGQSSIPGRVKIGLSVILTLMIYDVVAHPALGYEGLIGYAVIVVREVITGLIIGFSASICNNIVLFAGNIIDMDIGLSMATEFNPEMRTETTISGSFYYYVVMLLLVASNMHSYIIRAVCDSFTVVPIAGAAFDWESLVTVFTKFIIDLFIIGFRIFLPYFACIMVLNVILGIMAKVAPQMNMFAVGIQLKLLTGLVVMLLTIFMVPNVADYIFQEIKTMVVLSIESMY